MKCRTICFTFTMLLIWQNILRGGCGIRPFIDLLILDNLQEVDNKKRDNLLKQGNLLKFANASPRSARRLFTFLLGPLMHTSPEMVFGSNRTQPRTTLNQEGRKPFPSLLPSRLPLAQRERPGLMSLCLQDLYLSFSQKQNRLWPRAFLGASV